MVTNERLIESLNLYANVDGPWKELFVSLRNDVEGDLLDSINWRERHRDKYIFITTLKSRMT